jgi:hypothetical protein
VAKEEVYKMMHEENYGYRREGKRVSCFLAGNFLSSKNVSHKLVCYDLSYKGMGIIVPRPLRINTQIKAEISAKNDNQLSLQGKVCWCKKASNGWRSGIAFNRALPFALKKIV